MARGVAIFCKYNGLADLLFGHYFYVYAEFVLLGES